MEPLLGRAILAAAIAAAGAVLALLGLQRAGLIPHASGGGEGPQVSMHPASPEEAATIVGQLALTFEEQAHRLRTQGAELAKITGIQVVDVQVGRSKGQTVLFETEEETRSEILRLGSRPELKEQREAR